MKIILTDNTYDGNVKYEVEDKQLGSDLSIIFEYLENYKQLLDEQIKYSAPALGRQIVWQAKADKIKQLTDKYNNLISFVKYIESEETGL